MLGTIKIVGVLTQSKEPQYLERWKSLKAQGGIQLNTLFFIIIIGVISNKKSKV